MRAHYVPRRPSSTQLSITHPSHSLLAVLRQLGIERSQIEEFYEAESDELRRNLVHLYVLTSTGPGIDSIGLQISFPLQMKSGKINFSAESFTSRTMARTDGRWRSLRNRVVGNGNGASGFIVLV